MHPTPRLFVALAVLFACTQLCVAQNSSTVTTADAQAIFGSSFTTKAKDAGVTQGYIVITQGQDVIYQNSFGDEAVDYQNTLVPIASLSKTITATMIMGLVKDGKIDLKKDVMEYLKKDAELANPPLIKDIIVGNYSDYGGSPTYPTTEKITTHNLLTHTAGFDERAIGIFANTYETSMAPLKSVKTIFPPRIRKANEVITYSNHGITLAGVVAELVSGQSFADLVKKYVFDPLGMSKSSVELTPKIAADKNFAQPKYKVNGVVVTDPQLPWGNQWPAGGVVSTMEEMTRYAIAHANKGISGNYTLLDPATIEMQQATQFRPNPKTQGIAYPWFDHVAGDINGNGTRWIEHKGDISPYHLQLNIVPSKNVSMLVFYTGPASFQGTLDQHWEAFLEQKVLGLACTPGPNGKKTELKDGICYEVWDQIPRVTEAKAALALRERMYACEGCYRLCRSEHTTWMKVQNWFGLTVCARLNDVEDAHMIVTGLGPQWLALLPTDLDKNVFRAGLVVVNGEKLNYWFKRHHADLASFIQHTNSFNGRYFSLFPAFATERVPSSEAGLGAYVVLLIFWLASFGIYILKIFHYRMGCASAGGDGIPGAQAEVTCSQMFSISPMQTESTVRANNAKFINRRLGTWVEFVVILFTNINLLGVLVELTAVNPTKTFPQGGGIVFVLLFPVFTVILLPLMAAQLPIMLREQWFDHRPRDGAATSDAKFPRFLSYWYVLELLVAICTFFFQVGWNIFSPSTTTI